MQNTLYEFLVLNKKLSLPGIGTISLKQNSSQLDFTNRQFTAPAYYFTLESKDDKPSKKLFEWLSSSLGITEWDAIKSVNDFSHSVKSRISETGEMTWENIGVIKRDNAGNLKLDSSIISIKNEQPVIAEKVIREKAEHTVLVGEKEKSAVEMEEYFAERSSKRNYGWIIAVILTVLAIMFIGWHFSEKGFIPASAGNTSVIRSN
jgi:hypothetical protein